MASTSATASVDLYWLPLGAGGHSVRLNGKVFEVFAARRGRRNRCDLYHSALDVQVPDGRFIIEQAPAWNEDAERGVVAEGPVGARRLGRFRLFRYEVRCWRDGVIPDLAEAVASPLRVSDDPDSASRILELVAHVPTPVWGRDELGAGEMWNSNCTTCGATELRSGVFLLARRVPLRLVALPVHRDLRLFAIADDPPVPWRDLCPISDSSVRLRRPTLRGSARGRD
jgi:hypothetical protein